MPQPLPTPDPDPTVLNSIQRSILEADVIETIRTIFDPELPVNIYDLGLIYDVRVAESGFVDVLMTLTSPACPVAETLPPEVEVKVRETPGVKGAKVELTWDPPFTIERIPEHVRLDLGLL
jgi:FeS assembly SUF system protein